MGNHTAKNSEKTVKNLKPFPKGKSGNPNGRPKKLPALEELLLSNMSEEKDGIMAVDLVIKKLRQKAIQGDMKAIEYLLDRVYGKMKDNVISGSVKIVFGSEEASL